MLRGRKPEMRRGKEALLPRNSSSSSSRAASATGVGKSRKRARSDSVAIGAYRSAAEDDLKVLLGAYANASTCELRDIQANPSNTSFAGTFRGTFLPIWQNLKFSHIHEAATLFGLTSKLYNKKYSDGLMEKQLRHRTNTIFGVLLEIIVWQSDSWHTLGAIFALYALHATQALTPPVAINLNLQTCDAMLRSLCGAKLNLSHAQCANAINDAETALSEMHASGSIRVGEFAFSVASLPSYDLGHSHTDCERNRIEDLVRGISVRSLGLNFDHDYLSSVIAETEEQTREILDCGVADGKQHHEAYKVVQCLDRNTTITATSSAPHAKR